MLKRTLSFILIGLILNLAFYSTVNANANPEKEAKFALKVKNAIAKLGSGTEVRVEVKLRDKTKIKGYVSDVRENSFVVVDSKTGTSSEIPYPQVKSIKGKNNLTGEQIAAIAGFVILIFLVVVCVTTDCV